MFAVELIQSILLIISAILMIISAIGFLTLDKNMNNLIYARIHIVGVFDVAFIIAMIGLQQYLLAGIYLVIAPFTAHAIANAFYNSEDKVNNLKNKEVEVESSDDENPFVHNINKVKEMGNKSDESNEDSIKFSISTLEISEDEEDVKYYINDYYSFKCDSCSYSKRFVKSSNFNRIFWWCSCSAFPTFTCSGCCFNTSYCWCSYCSCIFSIGC